MVTALILIGLVIWLVSGSLFGLKSGFHISNPFSSISIDNLTGPYNAVGTYTVPADGIDSIDVSWVAGEVTITPYSGDVIKLTEYARRDLKDNEKLVFDTSGGKLEVKYVAPSLRINMATKKLEMLVPEALAKKLSQLNVNATSAALKISGFEVKSFDVHETSGDSDISGIKTDSADIHSVSGTINITGLTAAELTLGSTSGELNLSGVTADAVTADTVSGAQLFSGTFKDVDAGSVSGEISVISTVNPDKIDCGTVSGGITVTIPGGTDLTVSYKTTSGRFTSDLPVKTGDSANYTFSSVSGSIHLKAA